MPRPPEAAPATFYKNGSQVVIDGASFDPSTGSSVIRNGAVAPADALGANGDYYIRTSNYDLYYKAAGTYTVIGNIKGSNGTNGTNGAAGTNAAEPIYQGTSGATRTAQTLANITNLAIPSTKLVANQWYEFEAFLSVASSSVAGIYLGYTYSGTGGILVAGIDGIGSTTLPYLGVMNSPDSFFGPVCAQASAGPVTIKGMFFSGTVLGDLALQHAKVTSGTSTINNRSWMKLIKINDLTTNW